MKCQYCNIEMDYVGQKNMIGKVWDKFVCSRCKDSFHKVIKLVHQNEEKKQ